MKRFLLSFIFILIGIAAEAQTITTSVTVTWAPNPPEQLVINYKVILDGTQLQGYSCNSTECRANGNVMGAPSSSHSATLSAINMWGESPTTTVTFQVNLPTSPTNVRVGPTGGTLSTPTGANITPTKPTAPVKK